MKSFIVASFLFISVTLFGQIINPDFNEEYIQTYLPTIEVTMHDTAYDWMVHPDNIWSDDYQYATAVYKGSNGLVNNYDTLGIRLRGNTSRAKDKKSFKLHFEKFTDDQYFFGLKKVNLKAETNDPSLIREHLVMNMYRDINVPVARVNHVKLYINSVYMGLYSSIEQIDSRFLNSRFGIGSGNLYKCSWGADLYNGAIIYDDAIYELKTNESANNRSNLQAFVSFLANSSNTDFENNIESYINVESYIMQLAIEVLTGHWDAYSYNMNNYYLYYNPEKNWFEYIPYDADNTLGIDWVNRDWSDRDIYDWARHGNNPRPLHTRLLNIDKYEAMYSRAINDHINSIYNVTYQMNIANNLHSLISTAVQSDTYYPLDFGFTYQNFTNSLTQNISGTHVDYGIEPFIAKRVSSANNQLNQVHLSILDEYFDSEITLFPVPLNSNKILNIEIDNQIVNRVNISIFNVMGQIVLEEKVTMSHSSLNLYNLNTGVYFIQLSDMNNNRTVVKKIIIN